LDSKPLKPFELEGGVQLLGSENPELPNQLIKDRVIRIVLPAVNVNARNIRLPLDFSQDEFRG